MDGDVKLEQEILVHPAGSMDIAVDSAYDITMYQN